MNFIVSFIVSFIIAVVVLFTQPLWAIVEAIYMYNEVEDDKLSTALMVFTMCMIPILGTFFICIRLFEDDNLFWKTRN